MPELKKYFWPKKSFLPDRESNPGLPRDRRRSSPLDYRGLDADTDAKKRPAEYFSCTIK